MKEILMGISYNFLEIIESVGNLKLYASGEVDNDGEVVLTKMTRS
jgi:hypothetical protein